MFLDVVMSRGSVGKVGLKRFFTGTIGRKIIFSFLVIALLLGLIAGAGSFYLEKSAKGGYVDVINGVEADFENLQKDDIRALSASLEIAVQDENLKAVYLEKNREQLYDYGQSLFGRLKDDYGITHFYFIEPSGKCFVRLHNKDVFGDSITRATFDSAVKTKEIGAGIELGETAFALRVVKPYYDGGDLIGYMELGEEIDRFLDMLKSDGKNEFSIIAGKEYIDKAKWASVREVAGLRNNWNDLENHVVISSTTEKEIPCFTSDNVLSVHNGKRVFETFESDDGEFVCGGFPLIDASGDNAGVVFVLIESSSQIGFVTRMKYSLLGVIVFVVLSIVGLSFFLNRSISRPIDKLTFAAREIERGNFKSRVDVKTGDELETLGNTFNKTMGVLAKTDEERKQIDHAKTEFISITSHELRSPMTPMKAQLQMLLGEYFGKVTSKQKESLNIVLRNTIRLDSIIQDFLEVSRIEAARLKFKFVKTTLSTHLVNLVKEMAGFMPEKKIKIELKAEKLPVIEVDPDRVMQVVRNLVNNAMKFSPENSVITISAGVKDGMIEISVADQGIGVKKEDQIRLFEPFFQAEQTMYREKGGTGLGLAICRGIAETQNGKIWLESEAGKGTTFFFTVPLKPVRETKSIKLLFSAKDGVDKKVKKLFVDVLGPLGEKEFERLNIKGLDYKSLMKYVDDLSEKGVLDALVVSRAKSELIKIFEIRKKVENVKVDVPAEIKKLYLEKLGSMGEKEFGRLKKIDVNSVVGNVNELEKVGVLNSREASRFRDGVIRLFRLKEINGSKVSAEKIKSEGMLKNEKMFSL